MYSHERALELLSTGTGVTGATFRPGQEEAIRHVVEGRGRLLVVQRTGWGKSFVYFIATKLLREARHGPALLISPLLSLMRNQLLAANRMGLEAFSINSDNFEDWPDIEAAVAEDRVDVLLISPERLASERFRRNVLTHILARLSMLVVDEAHCISDWGHDFRPHYRLLERVIPTLPDDLRLLATTATANRRVMDDLEAVLGPNLEVQRGDLKRDSLALQTISLPRQADRLAWLASVIPTLPGSGIIYTLTVRDAENVAAWLRFQGLAVEAYTSLSGPRRRELEQALLDNQVKALAATLALGMGFDKADLAFVIHYQSPGSVVAYYQQVGRAGRALDAAYGVLLDGEEDAEITDFFIQHAFPSRNQMQLVLLELARVPEGLSIPALMARLNLSWSRIEQTLQLLALETPAPVVEESGRWQLTGAGLTREFWQRPIRLTRLRQLEQEQMREYAGLSSGHMAFLVKSLDSEESGGPGPGLEPLPVSPCPSLVEAAIDFIRGTSYPIEPRTTWPAGAFPIYRLSGEIDSEHRAMPGKALCVWGDGGWGPLVRAGKYELNRFSDELVAASVRLIRDWSPVLAPTWVTSIPSLRHARLVPEFAERLASELDLPYHPVLRKVDDRPEQKGMANNAQQARNLDGSLAIDRDLTPKGPVLLVDDIVYSGWTLSVATWLLRTAGAQEVFPFALSTVGHSA